MSLTAADREHVGYRYGQWISDFDYESGLSPAEKAIEHDRFAAEFEVLPPRMEPYAGWVATMAYLCRRIASRLRGEPVDEWNPPKPGGWVGPSEASNRDQ